jgi:hypothetical protein
VLEGGTKALSWSGDGTLRLWDLGSCCEIVPCRRGFANSIGAVDCVNHAGNGSDSDRSVHRVLVCHGAVAHHLAVHSAAEPPLSAALHNKVAMPPEEWRLWFVETLEQWPFLLYHVDPTDGNKTLVQKLVRPGAGDTYPRCARAERYRLQISHVLLVCVRARPAGFA